MQRFNKLYRYLLFIMLGFVGITLYGQVTQDAYIFFNTSSTDKTFNRWSSFNNKNSRQIRAGISSATLFYPAMHYNHFNNFTTQDFANWTKQQNLSSADLFKQYQFFCYPAYIELLRLQPQYEQEIMALHNHLEVDYETLLSRLGGVIMGTYSPGLANCVAQEMAYITQQQRAKNAQTQAVINRIEADQLGCKQGHVQETCNYNSHELSQHTLVHLGKQWRASVHHSRLCKRADAVDAVIAQSSCCTQHTYTVSNDIVWRYKAHQELLQELSSCYGNAIQQLLHQEFIDIAHTSCTKPPTFCLQTHFDTLLPEAIMLGLCANKAGFIEQAGKLADICWVILDSGSAIVEGFVEGVTDTLKRVINTVQHPLQTASHMINGLATLLHSVAYATDVVAQLSVFYVTDHEKYYLRRHEIAEFANALSQKIKNYLQQLSARDGIKTGSKIIIEALLMQRMFLLGSKICTKAVEVIPKLIIKNNKEPVYALINAPGVQMVQSEVSSLGSVAAQTVTAPLHKKIAQVGHLLDVYAPHISSFLFNVEQECVLLKQKFATACKGWDHLAHKYLTIDAMHIFGMELTAVKEYFRMGGFHHDYMGLLEKTGAFKLIDVVKKAGFYDAELWINGIKVIPRKTFFPQSWSREKVMQTIAEVYNDCIKKGIKPRKIGEGKFLLEGSFNNEIGILFHFDIKGKIKSVYPYFKR